ncbi:poly(A)-specific ribonuclease PARN-like isoform X2 [Panicum virgatum]|uniref:poly(A)-specific ribonuclease PARN-like isoform X2 n=1 Tax=Panicum virgatum TaxID=38727 RepID=UPI0019D6606B|nr:poly(A)-specific ribonuclease PARN-like isoform X2 [Panicum virgatum]
MAAPRAAAASAKQVTRRNFAEAARELGAHLESCDYVAVAAQKTGAPTGWRRALPVDTAETAYLKAKVAAESFQPLQIAVCPFLLRNSSPSTLVAYPYNFHIFPRDELQLGMPSYSFYCQSSYLSTMANAGFDFNMCIYDGISYLSRVQESFARQKICTPHVRPLLPLQSTSVADSVFKSRIKSRIMHWRKGYAEPNKKDDGSLVSSLSRLILGGETYGSRPSISIDVCSDHQVQLVLEAVNHISDDLVPLVVPDKVGAARAVCVIFTSSKEDKNLLLMDIQQSEEEKFCGFREVIDLLSSSQKPIVSYNCLNDLTMMHSKFVAPLPPNMHEFMCSLKMVFSSVVDVSHLWRQIGPLRKAKNIQAALSYLQRQYFVPMEIKIPEQDTAKVVSTENIVFLWGFRGKSVKELKSYLPGLHQIFSEDFEVKLLDKTCSALLFRNSGTAMQLLKEISSESPSLNNFFSEGLKAAGFEVYRKVCRLGLWDSELAEALERVSAEVAASTLSECNSSQIYWNSSLMLDLKEYLEC